MHDPALHASHEPGVIYDSECLDCQSFDVNLFESVKKLEMAMNEIEAMTENGAAG